MQKIKYLKEQEIFLNENLGDTFQRKYCKIKIKDNVIYKGEKLNKFLKNK